MPEPSFMLKASQDPVEIAGIGLVESGGLPLARAAERMAELQDDAGKPLSGEALTAAAKKWADTVGLDVSAQTPAPSPPSQPAPSPPTPAQTPASPSADAH